MKKAKHSKRDSKGLLYIACSECDRGGVVCNPTCLVIVQKEQIK